MSLVRAIPNILMVLTGCMLASATPIVPTGVTVSVPAGSNNGSRNGLSAVNAFIDDVFLSTLSLPNGVVISATNSSFRAVGHATVLSGRSAVNAEFGDADTGSDGSANPFVTAGLLAEGASLPDAQRESIDPSNQDPSILASFGSLSLVQGIDGEGSAYTLQLIFTEGIVDNDAAVDQVPELMFFERGANSDFDVQLILGGTLSAPVLHSTVVSILRGQMFRTGIFIDTIEIGSGQELGAVGLDLNDFGLAADTAVYGIRITSTNNSGADLYGNFLSAAGPDQFRPVPDGLNPVPEPGTIVLFGGAAVVLAALRRKRGMGSQV